MIVAMRGVDVVRPDTRGPAVLLSRMMSLVGWSTATTTRGQVAKRG